MQLLCVSPDLVRDFWPVAEPFLKSAMVRTGLGLFNDVAADLFAGKSLLWIAWDGAAVEAAAATQLQATENGLVCVIVACGGRRLGRWLPLLAEIEAYAAKEGCSAVRIFGRMGWQRVLSGYRPSNVVLDKPLTPVGVDF